MNTYALIPLVATFAYVPLFGILLANRRWARKQKLFLLFLIPAILWSLTDFLFRSDYLAFHKLLLVKIGICILIWMFVQFHYFVKSFYKTGRARVPLLYALVASTVALAALDYIPQGLQVTGTGIHVQYGVWIVATGFIFLFTAGTQDIYSLVRKFRASSDPSERNQISYLVAAIAVFTMFVLSSLAPRGGEYPTAHIGNFAVAALLTYAVVAQRLLDVMVILRRALLWLGVGIAGIAAYLLLFYLAHLMMGFAMSLQVVAVTAFTAIVAALVVYKLLGFVHVKIEQAFAGEKYGYRQRLSEFVKDIYSVSTLEHFGRQFVSLLSQSIGCHRAGLLMPQGKSGDLSTRFAYPPVKDNPMNRLLLKYDSPVTAWLKRENTILPERNLSIFPEFQSIWQHESEEIRAAGVEIFVPLISKDELTAVLVLSGKRDGKRYTVEDIDLLEFIASRVAASMGKEYSHEQLLEQDEELTLINRLTTIITSSVSIQEIFDGFAEELKKVVDVDWATISLLEGEQLHLCALSSTIGSAWRTGERLQLEGTAGEYVCREKKSLYEHDLGKYRRFWTGEHHSRQGIRSIVYLPLVVKDESIGLMVVGSRKPDAYSAKQIRLLERVALQVAMPIENAQLYAKAEQRSRVDELTGLFNRRHFDERLKEEIARSARYDAVFSVFLLDLDNFKTYNDMYGHPSGDRLLHQVGRIIRTSVRTVDQAFRYGGDEFVVILPETALEDAYAVAERVREQVFEELGAEEIGVTCSIGLASYPADGVIGGELVTVADTALYYAKRTGGNRLYLSSKILSDSVQETDTYGKAGSVSAVYALASAVEARDSYTYGHSRKVNTYAVALGEALGLAPDVVAKLGTAALLHDIGKIGIPDNVLNKNGALDADDWTAIRSHPRLGANIVSKVPGLVPCINGILYHHERWDGTGYPEQLGGEEIPLEARIMAIADTFSAMTSNRPYRDALAFAEVVRELRQCAGTQFDPGLVEVFIGIINAGFPEEAKAKQESV